MMPAPAVVWKGGLVDPVTVVLVGALVVALTVVGWLALTLARARRRHRRALEERGWLLERERESAARTAVGAERARIARDMHDVLAHSVGLMVVQAEGGASVVRSDAGRAEAAFDAIAETGREALVQLRHALGLLREQAPETAGVEAIPSLVERARRTGLDVSLDRGPVPALDPQVGATAFRVVQEALTNVVKHAGARKVFVTLGATEEGLRVTVRDDGRGGAAVFGHGLSGMRERVTSVGGRLQTGPRADGPGFEVAATLPAGG